MFGRIFRWCVICLVCAHHTSRIEILKFRSLFEEFFSFSIITTSSKHRIFLSSFFFECRLCCSDLSLVLLCRLVAPACSELFWISIKKNISRFSHFFPRTFLLHFLFGSSEDEEIWGNYIPHLSQFDGDMKFECRSQDYREFTDFLIQLWMDLRWELSERCAMIPFDFTFFLCSFVYIDFDLLPPTSIYKSLFYIFCLLLFALKEDWEPRTDDFSI